jgi:hypothetical protein
MAGTEYLLDRPEGTKSMLERESNQCTEGFSLNILVEIVPTTTGEGVKLPSAKSDTMS